MDTEVKSLAHLRQLLQQGTPVVAVMAARADRPQGRAKVLNIVGDHVRLENPWNHNAFSVLFEHPNGVVRFEMDIPKAAERSIRGETELWGNPMSVQRTVENALSLADLRAAHGDTGDWVCAVLAAEVRRLRELIETKQSRS